MDKVRIVTRMKIFKQIFKSAILNFNILKKLVLGTEATE